jgi:membrane protease YdiL (CAAX protease family)
LNEAGAAPVPAAEPLAPRDLVVTWVRCLFAIAIAALVPLGIVRANLAGIAAFAFIAIPDNLLRRRHEHWDEYGFPWWGWRDQRTWGTWGRGLIEALALSGVVFPLFTAVFVAYAWVVPHLPASLAQIIAPYALPAQPHWPPLPPDLPLRIAVQLLVVALPEELFYRGFMQTAWARTRPERRIHVIGADLGAGFLWTQVLFAAGHLVVFQPWRLATFFPGLLFGWLRARTGYVAAPVFFHAFSNLFVALLEAAFYG